jgi:ParB/RepB/Spo0J family partition protein
MASEAAVQVDLAALFPDPEKMQTGEGMMALYLIEETPTPAPTMLRVSLEQRGQLQPVILNNNGNQDEAYRIVDGRRRIRAARDLGWTHIDALIYAVDPLVEASLAVTANAIRSDNLVSDLAAIQKMAEGGLTAHDIAAVTGLKRGTIRKRLKLLRLDPAILDGVKSGVIAFGVAESAASVPRSAQEALAAIFAETGKLTGDDVANVTRVASSSALASLGDELFASATPEPRDPFETLLGALRDFRHNYEGAIDRDRWAEACVRAWEADT